jgi:1,4-dihydroxy-2-naphthoate octaprenyltransferase
MLHIKNGQVSQNQILPALNSIFIYFIFFCVILFSMSKFDISGNALGGDMYCMGALHLYTPLPFRPGIGGFGDLFRSHFFINAGNCGNFQSFSFGMLTLLIVELIMESF